MIRAGQARMAGLFSQPFIKKHLLEPSFKRRLQITKKLTGSMKTMLQSGTEMAYHTALYQRLLSARMAIAAWREGRGIGQLLRPLACIFFLLASLMLNVVHSQAAFAQNSLTAMRLGTIQIDGQTALRLVVETAREVVNNETGGRAWRRVASGSRPTRGKSPSPRAAIPSSRST